MWKDHRGNNYFEGGMEGLFVGISRVIGKEMVELDSCLLASAR